MVLTVGSLFSGIGGIDLGLERAGMESRWFVEWDAHCQNVLRRHWPGLPVYGDITTVDWTGVEPVDVLAGGFPCQPVSGAGQQKAQADERWLWPEFFRAIRALRPRYVLVENVANLLAVNGGSAMGEVVGDLAACGYDAEWDCIPAEAVGALHERDRLWIVAYASSARRWEVAGRTSRDEGANARWAALHGHKPCRDGTRRSLADANGGTDTTERRECAPAASEGSSRRARRGRSARDAEWQEPVRGAGQGPRDVADAHGRRRDPGSERAGIGRVSVFEPSRDSRDLQEVADAHRESLGRPTESRSQRGIWGAEPDVGRVAHGIPDRVERLRSLGNAVVPQVVEWIGRRIVAFDAGEAVAA